MKRSDYEPALTVDRQPTGATPEQIDAAITRQCNAYGRESDLEGHLSRGITAVMTADEWAGYLVDETERIIGAAEREALKYVYEVAKAVKDAEDNDSPGRQAQYDGHIDYVLMYLTDDHLAIIRELVTS